MLRYGLSGTSDTAPTLPLESEEDLQLMKRHYDRLASHQPATRASTFRLFVTAVAAESCIQEAGREKLQGGVQTRRQRSAPDLYPVATSSAQLRPQRVRDECLSGATPIHKKQKPHRQQ